MAVRNYSSTAVETTLSAPATDSGTSLTVSSTTGFPAPPFVLTLDVGTSTQEVVLVTNVAGTTLTVTRGYDSTTASAHEIGAVVQHSHAAIDFREANAHVNAESGVHGVNGDVVGTTDTQTLTNKTLTSPTVNGEMAGSAFDWQDWAPTWENVTVGNGVLVARYVDLGDFVNFTLSLTAGTTTTSGAIPTFTLPVAPRNALESFSGFQQDDSVGESRPARALFSSVKCYVQFLDPQALWINSTALATGDIWYFSGTYEKS